ncbi:DNA-binding transcriptional LysR family regulator [Rhizobium sp. BK196]|uniref:LysR family transcriptional regulator n=1 Tax=Rhizobium sp. BK196 TaxID=2587073 RepID=UPI00161450E0|nr:LysR family transcriptional regulator [Rhizobium sp. BK196]MBB3310098.1 DNA-binding transcriptional LysR family regulator [Rhizobium sp. BK196]
MSYRPTLDDLNAFAAIVTHRSFRKAAGELGLSPSTLSHMMRNMEARMGVRLLHRTTRSVAATEAGEMLLDRLKPVLRDLDLALDAVGEFGRQPSGTLRINASEIAARVLLNAAIPLFLERYPEISLDIVTENRLVDIVGEGFDAGIRLRESVPLDMIAVEFGGEARFLAIASSAYLKDHKQPKTPEDLKRHRCIRLRMPSGKLYRWEFEKHGQEVTIEVSGALTLDHVELMAEAAVKGLGIAYVPERVARPYLASGDLISVLDDWCPSIPGLCLYYPGHRHVPQSLRAFISVLTEVERQGA